LQLKETHSVTDEFFDLTNTTKSRYHQSGEDSHGWIELEQQRWARNDNSSS